MGHSDPRAFVASGLFKDRGSAEDFRNTDVRCARGVRQSEAFWRAILLASCLLGSALTIGPAATSAQTLEGRVYAADSGEGVPGALLKVLGEDGRIVSTGATGVGGRFSIILSPAAHRLLVEHIGFESEYRPLGGLRSGTVVEMEVPLTTSALALDGIEVEADNQCRSRPTEGEAVYRLWNEARKALENAVWTQETQAYRYRLRHFSRDLTPDGRRVVRERAREEESVRQVPFKSVPIDQLMEQGFADTREGRYYAPDAEVLLSDEFADGHCFELAPEQRAVRFRPLHGQRRSDIDGRVWFHQDGALGGIEYKYVNLDLPNVLESPAIGGEVNFQVLPNGLHVVSEWHIRMPNPGRRMSSRSLQVEMYLEGISDVGASLVEVLGSEGPAWARAGMGSVVGTVWDSLATEGLAGVRVRLDGTEFSTTTDRRGRFELGPLYGGEYSVVVSVPYLRELGYQSPPLLVTVPDGERGQVTYTAPRLATALEAACSEVPRPTRVQSTRPGTGVHERGGVLVGYVRSEDPQFRVSDRVVRVTWGEWRIGTEAGGMASGSTEEARLGIEVTTDESGFYRACWVPRGVALDIEVVPDIEAGTAPTNSPVRRDLARLLEREEEFLVIPPDRRVGRRDVLLPPGW